MAELYRDSCPIPNDFDAHNRIGRPLASGLLRRIAAIVCRHRRSELGVVGQGFWMLVLLPEPIS